MGLIKTALSGLDPETSAEVPNAYHGMRRMIVDFDSGTVHTVTSVALSHELSDEQKYVNAGVEIVLKNPALVAAIGVIGWASLKRLERFANGQDVLTPEQAAVLQSALKAAQELQVAVEPEVRE